MKRPFIVYPDLECLLEKMSTCHNDPKKSLKKQLKKVNIKLLVIQCSHNVYLMLQKIRQIFIEAKTVWKDFFKELKEHVTKIINYETKEMIPLTHEENISYKKQKVCYISKKNLVLMMTIKSIIK